MGVDAQGGATDVRLCSIRCFRSGFGWIYTPMIAYLFLVCADLDLSWVVIARLGLLWPHGCPFELLNATV